MNRNDRNIMMAALLVAVATLVAVFWLGRADGPEASPAASVPADSARLRVSSPRQPYYAVPASRAERFPFDPNTADSVQLLRLGLQPWQVRNIYKYRARGGVYRRKEDFARLYGLTVKQYRELEPYIRISADYQPAATLVRPAEPAVSDTLRRPAKLQAGEHVVLNTADTALLCRVPGIGPYYARQIVRRGQLLGGYVSVGQLDEIADFPQQAKQYFVVDRPQVRKLNVNRLTLEQLRRHPYINYYQAKAIVDYRRLHGAIGSLDDLSLLPDFTPEAIERLRPYVEY